MLIAMLLTLSFCLSASANIWNLPLGLSDLFEHDSKYAAYIADAKDQNTKKETHLVFPCSL